MKKIIALSMILNSTCIISSNEGCESKLLRCLSEIITQQESESRIALEARRVSNINDLKPIEDANKKEIECQNRLAPYLGIIKLVRQRDADMNRLNPRKKGVVYFNQRVRYSENPIIEVCIKDAINEGIISTFVDLTPELLAFIEEAFKNFQMPSSSQQQVNLGRLKSRRL